MEALLSLTSNSITKPQQWKQLGIGIKTETLLNEIELKTWILTHIPMNTWFLTKKLKVYNGRKKASSTNGAGITGCQPVEEWK